MSIFNGYKALLVTKILRGLLFVAGGLLAMDVGAALPGDLDTGFNAADIGVGYGDGADGAVNATAVQADGKVVIVGGFQTYNGIARNRIARLNVDGTLDTTFNPGSGVTGGDIYAIAIQAHDGKILIGGSFTGVNGATKNRIARLYPDGTLDTDFRGSGANASVRAILVQPDKKVLIGGMFTTLGSTTKNRIARLNQDGSLDSGFTAGANGAVNAIALQTDGKIVIGGAFTSANGAASARILRLFGTDGASDTSFVNNTGTGITGGSVNALAIDGAGKIVVAGAFTGFNAVTRSRIARVNIDGTLDTAFADGAGPNEEVNALQLQTDGKIVIGGNFSFYQIGPSAFAGRSYIARINADATLDSTFNPGSGSNAAINGLTLQSDGKIIIGGAFVSYQGIARNYVARINGDGSLEAFNSGSGISGQVNAVAIQPDGKIVIGGSFATVNGVARNNIARLNADGTLDTGFNPGTNAAVYAILLPTFYNGAIFIGGSFTSVNGITRNRIALLNTDGTLNTTFAPASGANGAVKAIAQHSTGILIGGEFTTINGTTRKYLARMLGSGYLDNAFAPNITGTSVNAIATNYSYDRYPFTDPNAPIYIGGVFTKVNSVSRVNIASVEPDGMLDIMFDPGTGASTGGGVNALAIDSEGRILLAGAFTKYNGIARAHIARASTSGALDLPFSRGVDGGNINALALQPDGKIVIAGDFTNQFAMFANSIATLNAENGDLDATFNRGSGAGAPINALALQGDGKVVVGGAFVSYNGVGRNRIARIYNSNDKDGDRLTDAQELALGNNPLNPADPPAASVSDTLLMALEEPVFGADPLMASLQGWAGATGGFFATIPAPRAVDVDGNEDACTVGSQGVWCFQWAFAGIDAVSVTHDANNFLTPAITDAFRIAVRGTHACIISKSQGVKCWGTTTTDPVVANIPAELQNTNLVTDIEVGVAHACALRNFLEPIYCWGDNSHGQAPSSFHTRSELFTSGDSPLYLAVGDEHSCAIVRNSQGATDVRCWGDNTKGQLNIPAAAQVSPVRIAAGANHTCVVTGNYEPGNNKVVCWGDNSRYQTFVPTGITNPVDVRAGDDKTCVVQAGHSTAVSALRCWPIGINTGTDPETNWYATDSDNDGINDTDELSNPTVTNPQSNDTDYDGIPDGVDPYPQDSDKKNATYKYNHLGQRASKTVNGITTYFVYSDVDGQLLGEYKADGSPIRQYVYVEGERVAMMQYNGTAMSMVYLGNNHIGVPQYAWDMDGAPVYERVQAPFGENHYASGSATVPLRFPGQYADGETGFNQNWNRDYDPAIGRYLQSDPIGLGGGINTYGYALQNPVANIDPAGLCVGPLFPACVIIAEGSAGGITASTVNAAGAVIVGGIIANATGSDSSKSDADTDPKTKKDKCIAKCTETHLPTKDYGVSFWRCVNECMEEPDDCE